MMPSLLSSAGLAALLFFAACSKPSSHGFRRTELTKNDIVSLFDVPLDRFACEKFEWSLAREHYVRAVLDRSDDGGATWREAQTFPRDLPVVDATLIYRLPRFAPGPGNDRRLLELRLGGRGIGISGWSGSSTILELPGDAFQTESQFTDPERILIVKSGTRAYRLRLEAQEKPWANR
jgi:hypothetical protein